MQDNKIQDKDRPDSKESEGQKSRAILNLSIVEHRDRLAAAQPMLNPANVPFFDMLLPVKDHVKIPIRLYVPKGKKGPLQTVFYIPNTAFIASEIKFTHVICSHLCEKSQCQIVVINHRLAPENQFPKGYQDAYNVFKYFMQEMPENYLIDKHHVAIAGYSSGGNFAATMALQARKEGINVVQLVLASPIVDLSRSLRGFEDYEKQDKAISEEFVNFFLKLYVPESANLKDPVLSPFWEKKEEVRHLPRTAILLAQYDRFRSDAEHYYTKLKEDGVAVERFVACGEDHSYLWYRLEVVEKIADIITTAFKPEPIRSLSPKHRFVDLTPGIPKPQHKKDEHAEVEAISQETPRSKL